ncbi:hypothetical protein [Bacillus sp. LL01]|uniref:hypothetical protein n=1 Tax=Bacillus sp. LL01 TaxID=1665556 RepID=UPI000FFEE3B1|nr:hypothetical protein [Bacillus sp. LL01]
MKAEESIKKQHTQRTNVLERGERWRLRLEKNKPTSSVMSRYHYDRLTEILFVLFDDDFCYRVEEFHEKVKEYRTRYWKDFHMLVENVFNEEFEYTRLPGADLYLKHRDIPFRVSRFRECQVCGSVFYCNSNGKTNVCSSKCESVRDNAATRNRRKGTDAYVYDGQFVSLKPSTRAKYEEEMFLYYNPVANDDNPQEQGFFEFVMSQQSAKQMEGYGDPQDIVCGTSPTHKPHNGSHKSRMPMLRMKDTGGRNVYTVNIKSGNRENETVIPAFEGNLLEIKKELPKTPRNYL